MKLALLALLRDSRRHPWQLALTILCIALGVAVVVGVELANRAALGEFQRANQVTDGLATHRILGGIGGLDEHVYALVKTQGAIRDAAPVISAKVNVAGQDDTWQLLGIDPLTDFRIRQWRLQQAFDGSTTNDHWPLFVSESTGYKTGDSVTLVHNENSQPFQVAGIIRGDSDTPITENLLVTDIAWAQSFLNQAGFISYIELRLPGNVDIKTHLGDLPAPARIIDVNLYNSAKSDMTSAFRINLTALGLLALLIAMFLVFSSVSFHMARRRDLLSMLRLTGISQRGLASLLVIEAMLIATGGIVLGLVLGLLLANGLLILVTGTVNALYFDLSHPSLSLSFSTLALCVVLGYGATLLAVLIPLWMASRTTLRGQTLRSADESSHTYWQLKAKWLAPFFIILGLILLLIPAKSLFVPFAGLFLLVLSIAALTPVFIRTVCRWIDRTATTRLGLHLRLAIRNIDAHLSRTGIATIALSIAVATSLGVGLMIDSFRYSVDDWLQHYLRADVYVSSSDTPNRFLTEGFLQQLEHLPGVRSISVGRRQSLATTNGPLTLFSVRTGEDGFGGFKMLEQHSTDLWHDFKTTDTVLISEPLSRRLNLKAGDRITIPTDNGPHDFTIGGVYLDYSSDQGLVTMSWANYLTYFNDHRIVSAALYLYDSKQADQTLATIDTLATKPTGLYTRSNTGLRQSTLHVFDQTFRITDILKWLAIIIAVAGIISSLMTLQLERRKQHATFRAIGFSSPQLALQTLLETTITGLFAGLIAVPMGFILATALIEVINVRSFGWSMQTIINPQLIWQAVGLAVVAAGIGGLYPAWRISTTPISDALRYE